MKHKSTKKLSVYFIVILTIILGLLQTVTAQSYSRPFNIVWQKTFGGSQLEDNDYLSTTIVATPDGGYIFTGDTWSNDGNVSGNHGGQDAWVCKIDAAGNIQWQRCIGGSNLEYGQHIITTLDGGYLVGGYTESSDGDISGYHGKGDVYLAKLNSAGNIQWVKTIGGSKYEDCGKFLQNPDGTYMFAGLAESNNGDVSGNHGKSDAWVVKLDANGNILWQKCYGGSGDDGSDHQTQIIRSKEGGYLLVTYSNSRDGQVTGFNGQTGNGTNSDKGDAWFVKLDDNGNIQWQKCFGGPAWDFIENTIQLNDGSYLSTGGTHGEGGDIPTINNPTGTADWWLLKISQTGNLIWSRVYGGSGAEAIHGKPFELSNGDLIIPSGTRSNDHDCIGIHGTADLPDLWIVKTDPMGNILSYNVWGGVGYDNLSSAAMNSDGTIILSTTKDSTSNDYEHDEHSDIVIMKISPNPADTFAITTTSMSQNSYCTASSPFNLTVGYTKRGTFQGNNNFIAELSDANGSFASPIVIGSVHSKNSGAINCTIPGNLPAGNFYSIRIRSTNPVFTGITSGHLLSIQPCNITQVNKPYGVSNENHNKNYSLNIYPNPVSNSTTISLSLSQPQKVSLKIFDMSGRLAKAIVNKMFETGDQQITWNTLDMKAGIYLLKMEGTNYSETKKLVVIK